MAKQFFEVTVRDTKIYTFNVAAKDQQAAEKLAIEIVEGPHPPEPDIVDCREIEMCKKVTKRQVFDLH
jgi:hypothetical protein